ncbi:MAG: putative UDP-3-O-(3-hydroxymyristoyl)glucosamine N-acyltransferase [Promethearchaeota archaeon]|nr:MAG: putative UDP-3-O-(3-hydroxymyristoyl)glucosamine N-acyltransferase [Candidatus Lokiarchaeota archaeon]
MSSNLTKLEFINELYKLLDQGNYKTKTSEFKTILTQMKSKLDGLTIADYQGDYPTFIEPVYLYPNISIGDTVLLGPNVFIDEDCKLGNFTELSNSILCKNVETQKLVKLNNCIVDKDIVLPSEFKAENCLVTKNEKGNLAKIEF